MPTRQEALAYRQIDRTRRGIELLRDRPAGEPLWAAITEDLQVRTPDLDEYEVPQAEEAEELGEGLYNSTRSYLEQIEVYKAFQGK